MPIRKITYREAIEALRKNGFPQKFGAYWENDLNGYSIPSEERMQEGACAVGQMAYNLGVSASTIRRNTGIFHDNIVDLNDTQHLPIAEIADKIEKDYRNSLDKTLLEIDYIEEIVK